MSQTKAELVNGLSINAALADAVTVDSSGRLLLGTTTEGDASADNLTVADSGESGITVRSGSSNGGHLYFSDATSGSGEYTGAISYQHNGDFMKFNTNSTERMRIDSSGNVGIGVTPSFKLDVAGKIRTDAFIGRSNISAPSADASVYRAADNTLAFGTGSTERLRVDSSGHVIIGATSADSNSSDGIRLFNFGSVHATRTNEFAYVARRSSSNGGIILFRRDSTDVGNISVTTSATSYNSGSDYRLKQDDTPLIDGLTRLKQLKPIQFKWKNDTTKFVDGFFAHEVSPVVPESITGEKDAVYEEDDDLGHKKGDPIYQQIDQAKLVPLLTAALQEAVAKIEVLETKVAALEAA